MTLTPAPYEFGAAENKEFLELAAKAKWVAAAMLLLVILDLLTLLGGLKVLNSVQIIVGLITIASGFYAVTALSRASKRLIKIANTEGSDMPLLFQGTQRLEDAFIAMGIVIIGHIVGTFSFHEMMFGPYSIFIAPRM